MSTSIKAAILLAAVIAWLPAEAQLLGLGIETNIELSRQDLDIIRHTVSEQIHGAGWHYREVEQPGFRKCRQDHAYEKVCEKRPTVRNLGLCDYNKAQTGPPGTLQAEQLPATGWSMEANLRVL